MLSLIILSLQHPSPFNCNCPVDRAPQPNCVCPNLQRAWSGWNRCSKDGSGLFKCKYPLDESPLSSAPLEASLGAADAVQLHGERPSLLGVVLHGDIFADNAIGAVVNGRMT